MTGLGIAPFGTTFYVPILYLTIFAIPMPKQTVSLREKPTPHKSTNDIRVQLTTSRPLGSPAG